MPKCAAKFIAISGVIDFPNIPRTPETLTINLLIRFSPLLQFDFS
jgi:hypothetical protein